MRIGLGVARTAIPTSRSTPSWRRISLSASAKLHSARLAAARHAGSGAAMRSIHESSAPASMASRHAEGF